MIFLAVGVIAVGSILLLNQKAEANVIEDINPLEDLTMQRVYGLSDILPENQKGGYKTEFDIYFKSAADETGIPFALLKAHAIHESSLRPNAFVNENPQNKPEREGWASRGLMQLLWGNDKLTSKKLYDRFKKYGYPGDSLNKGDVLFDPHVNTIIAAKLISDNLDSAKGNLRDAINMYNAGVKESVRQAPNNYVDKVLNYYNKILGKV